MSNDPVPASSREAADSEEPDVVPLDDPNVPESLVPIPAERGEARPPNCPHCGGEGEINGRETNGPEGWVSDGKCPECHGTGRMSQDTRTVRSIAAILGWMNVPPRETLERDINALKARALAAPAAQPETETKR